MSDPVTVKPAFQSTAVDQGVAGQLGPSEWNAARVFSGGSQGDMCVRDTSSPTGASWAARSAGLQLLAQQITRIALGNNPPVNTYVDLWSVPIDLTAWPVGGTIKIEAWGEYTGGSGSGYRNFAVQLEGQVVESVGHPDTNGFAVPVRIFVTLIRLGATSALALIEANKYGTMGIPKAITYTFSGGSPLALSVSAKQDTPPWSDGGVALNAAQVLQY